MQLDRLIGEVDRLLVTAPQRSIGESCACDAGSTYELAERAKGGCGAIITECRKGKC